MIRRRPSRNRLLFLVIAFLCPLPQVVLGSPKTLTIIVTGNNFDPARLCTVTDSLGQLDRPMVVIHDALMRWDSVARTRAYTKLMQDAGVDVLVPSFFDLSQGADALFQAYRRLPQPVCANLRDSRGNLMFPAYMVLNQRGVKIGITSVMSDWTSAFREKQFWDFSIADPLESVRFVASQLRKKVDVLIVYAPVGADGSLKNLSDVDFLVTPHLWASENSGHESHSTRQGVLHRVDISLKARSRAPVVGVIYLDEVPAESTFAEKLRSLNKERAADEGYELEGIEYMDFRCPEARRIKSLRGRPVDEPGLLRGGETIIDREYAMKGPDVVSMDPPEPPGKCLSAQLGRGSGGVSLKWSYVFSDTLPRSPYDLYWRPPHLLKANLPPSHNMPSGWDGALRPNSELEHSTLNILRGVANQYFSWDEQDSLARLCDLTKPEPVLRQRLAGLSTLERHVAHLLGLVRFLELQDASGLTEKPSYWHRRGVVYANLQCDATGKILAATLLENNAWPSAADSVLQLIRTWPIPTQGHEGHADLTWNQNVALAVDRHETHLRLGEAAPGVVHQKMDDKALAVWFKNLVDADSSITLADFIDTGPETLLMQSSKDLDAEEVKLRERLGIVRAGPGQRWKVDALPDGTIGAQGTVRLAENGGIRLLPGKKESGGPLAWELPDQEIDLAVWLDASHLVIAGWSPVDHPRISGKYVQFSVPTLWVLDLEVRNMRRLEGPLLSPQAFREAWQGRRAVLDAAYPLVSWAR